jgi:hypothetical protein
VSRRIGAGRRRCTRSATASASTCARCLSMRSAAL